MVSQLRSQMHMIHSIISSAIPPMSESLVLRRSQQFLCKSQLSLSGANTVKIVFFPGRALFRVHDFGGVPLERLLFCTLYLGRYLEALLGGIQDVLDLLEQALVLLQLRVRFHSLLNQQLDVSELAEVEVPLAF